MNGLIVVIYGLPGTGKTTVCKLLLERFTSKYIGVDQVWPMLFSNPTYSLSESNAVFQETLAMTERLLPNNATIFIEGVFASASRFRPLSDIAEKYEYKIYKAVLTCDKKTALKRITDRPVDNIGNRITPESWQVLATKMDSIAVADLVIDTGTLSKKQAADLVAANINAILTPQIL